MQSEPLYIYRKGEGWIPRPVELGDLHCHYVDCEGKLWAVYDRKPVDGERWSLLWETENETILDALNWFTENKEPIENCGKWYDANSYGNYHYITFLPVNA